MEQTEGYKSWEKRRNKATYISYFIISLGGLEINAVMVTLLYYLVENFDISLSQARMYFSMAEFFSAVGQTISSIYIGRYVDKTRNLRLVVLVTLWATIVGNMLYALPFHLSSIFIGRFLCGLNEVFQVALCGKPFFF